MPPGASYCAAHASHRSARSGPPQRGQARRSSKDRIDERRQGLDGRADDQDQTRGAEEDEQRHKPLSSRLAPPQTAGSIRDGGRSVREHEPGAREPATTADHATSGSVSAERRFVTRASPATSTSMPLRRKVEYPSTARFTMGSPE